MSRGEGRKGSVPLLSGLRGIRFQSLVVELFLEEEKRGGKVSNSAPPKLPNKKRRRCSPKSTAA